MSYQLGYWKGIPEHSEEIIKPRRLKRVADIERVLRPIPKEVDYVSLERTDKQSLVFRIVWVRPNKEIEVG